MMKPRVFIGSSSEGLEVADALQELLEPLSEATVWTQDVFKPSRTTIESLALAVRKYDFAVLVMSPDDLVRKRSHEAPTPRDNVVFELGMFTGALGRDRAFFVHCRTAPPELPSDLLGIEALTYSERTDGNLKAALGPVASRLKRAFRDSPASLGERSILAKRAGVVLELTLKDVIETTGISQGLGIHLFVIEDRGMGAALYRLVRRRSSPATPTTWPGFRKGEAVVGMCWAQETAVALDLAKTSYAAVAQTEWEARDVDVRWGMNWETFRKTRQRFKMVGAVPMADQEYTLRGCISLNLGTRSKGSAEELWTDLTVSILERAAEIVGLFF